MTGEVKRILDQCRSLGIIVESSPDGLYLDLRYQAPPPEDLRQLLRAHKQEIISLLKPQSPQWHAQRIAQAVLVEGVCLFWSDALEEVIAFIKDEAFKKSVPAGIVTYTSQELMELLGEGKQLPPPSTLKLIHQAKRLGGNVADLTEHP